MPQNVKADRKTIDTVFVLLGLVAILVLIAVGTLAQIASNFATSSVTKELTAQNIFFPKEDDKALTSLPESDRQAMTKYAGQQLTNGAQAEVYADHFIAVHLSHIADGKTYSEISAEANANPDNTELKAKAQKLFQGETLRGMLLGSGYAYWTIGQIAQYAAVAAYAGAVLMLGLVTLGAKRLRR